MIVGCSTDEAALRFQTEQTFDIHVDDVCESLLVAHQKNISFSEVVHCYLSL